MNNRIVRLLMFLLWPLGSFIYSFFHFREPESKKYYLLFSLLYGATFLFVGDSLNFSNEYIACSQLPWSNFLAYISEDSAGGRAQLDVVIPAITFLLAKISSNPHLLYAFLSFIYTYFFIKSAEVLIRKLPNELGIAIPSVIFLLIFVLYIRFSAFNGARFWVACFYSTFLILSYFENRNIKYLFFLPIAASIHFSFFFINLVVVTYLMIGKYKSIVYAFLLVSFISGNFVKDILPQFVETNESINGRYESYAREDYKEGRMALKEKDNFFVRLGPTIARQFCPIVLFLSFYFRRKYLTKYTTQLYYFLVVFLSYLFLFEYAWELYRRFFEIFNLLVIAFLFFRSIDTLNLPKIRSDRFVLIVTIVFLLPNLLFSFRAGLKTVDTSLVVGNVVTVFYTSGREIIPNIGIK